MNLVRVRRQLKIASPALITSNAKKEAPNGASFFYLLMHVTKRVPNRLWVIHSKISIILECKISAGVLVSTRCPQRLTFSGVDDKITIDLHFSVSSISSRRARGPFEQAIVGYR